MNRRGFLKGILAAGVAPAFVRAEILMPVRELWVPPRVGVSLTPTEIAREVIRQLENNLLLTAMQSNRLIGAEAGKVTFRLPSELFTA